MSLTSSSSGFRAPKARKIVAGVDKSKRDQVELIQEPSEEDYKALTALIGEPRQAHVTCITIEVTDELERDLEEGAYEDGQKIADVLMRIPGLYFLVGEYGGHPCYRQSPAVGDDTSDLQLYLSYVEPASDEGWYIADEPYLSAIGCKVYAWGPAGETGIRWPNELHVPAKAANPLKGLNVLPLEDFQNNKVALLEAKLEEALKSGAAAPAPKPEHLANIKTHGWLNKSAPMVVEILEGNYEVAVEHAKWLATDKNCQTAMAVYKSQRG